MNRPGLFRGYGLTTVGLCLAVQVYVIAWNWRQSTLFSDDWLNFLSYRQATSFTQWLFDPVFGQVIPGHRLLTALVLDVFGASYVATQSIMALLALCTTLLFIRCLMILGLRLPTAAVVTLLVVVSPVQAPVLQWWSSAQCIIPSTLFVLVATWLAIEPRLFRSDLSRGLAVGLAYAAALTFCGKVLYAILPLGAVIASHYGRELRAVPELAMRCAVLLAGCFAVAVLYVLFLKLTGRVPVAHADATLQFVLRYASYGIVEGTLKASLGLGAYAYMVPAAWIQAGGPGYQGASVTLPLVLTVLALTLAVVVVVSTIRRGGWMVGAGWAILLIWLYASFITIANTRGVQFGLDSALSPRYQSDNVYYLLLAAVALWRLADDHASPRTPPVRAAQAGMPILAAGGAMAAAALVLAVAAHGYSSNRPMWDMVAVRAFMQNLLVDLYALDARTAILEDGELPDVILPTWMDRRSVRDLIPVWRQDVRIASSTDATHAILPNGRIVRKSQ